ncbi:5-formyltetrahydrofolate cyclo-ligase [Kitasatospora sp. MMS16-BH015]|uniref:5-formyltetrahydrofolate cyclo-ligase n=1 Tax=Kitasatospora sp. MMS16-BH015 TaxID=2018025 RepID=UPI000CA30CFF|nr:5-formyltetrahydrofolate cyclo-ligase [Kitasatospora sp. MMS16-BH015]AUG79281.1 5-formyltetrahydrofolate cyclo-ligase [Kitasatospora sp. MMS16-BH015]
MHNEKAELRSRLLTRRRESSPEWRETAALALAEHAVALAAPGSTVAAYVSVGGEPGTRPLLEALRGRGVRVLLPVLLPDNDLDWAEYQGPERLAPAGRGLLEPTAERLGPEAVRTAELVLLPGLAVDHRGLRLGRGGGSYDRVLARLARAGAEPLLVTLLYAEEYLPELPAEEHDRPVHAVVTPDGVTRIERG